VADRTNTRRPLYILCNVLSAAIWAAFLFTEEFVVMAVITVAYGTFYTPIISFLEAFTMEVLGREKKSYGRIRVWGSLAFIAVVLVFGRLIDVFSVRLIVPAILAGSLMLALVSFSVPRARGTDKARFTRGAGVLLQRQSLAFIFCAFLMLVSHGAYYGFFSIHLEQLGYSNTFIGLSWALASTAEIVVMVFSNALFSRISLERAIGLSFAAAVLRWAVLGWVTSPVGILLAQGLHALTYGVFHMASILYVDRLVPAAAKTLGQAVNNALTYGLGLMVGFFLNGALYGIIGSAGLFKLSSLIALAGGVLLAWFHGAARPDAQR
jgi:PPP family 3-phenylpropionic acid transporter